VNEPKNKDDATVYLIMTVVFYLLTVAFIAIGISELIK